MQRLEYMFQAIAEQKRTELLDHCANGGDDDLDPSERPDRTGRDGADDLGALKDFDDVTIGGQEMRVICPGRGKGWFYCLTIESQGFTIGQYQAQFVSERAPFDPEETPMPIFPEEPEPEPDI